MIFEISFTDLLYLASDATSKAREMKLTPEQVALTRVRIFERSDGEMTYQLGIPRLPKGH